MLRILQLLEHPQNVFYGRMIRANIALTEFSRGKKGEDGSMQKLDLAQATRLWLTLQNEVCALLDSTTGTVSMTRPAMASTKGMQMLWKTYFSVMF